MRHASLALAATLCISTFTHASECKNTGEFTGRIQTANLSETLQYGVARLEITQEGKQFYSGQGVIIGQVVGTQDNGLPILDHTVFLKDGTRIETSGDRVEQMTPTGKLENQAPCEFSVVERITDVWANRRLKKLSNDNHDIEATGTVSYCSDNNRNELELHGTVCFD